MGPAFENTVRELANQLYLAGYTVTDTWGPMVPFGTYRINNGPTLTEVEFIERATKILERENG